MIRRLFDIAGIRVNGPAVESIAISPSDNADLVTAIRAVTINSPGTISWVNWQGRICMTNNLPVGTYTMCAVRIRATGTTARDITGWV